MPSSDEEVVEEPQSRRTRMSLGTKGLKVNLFPGLSPSALKVQSDHSIYTISHLACQPCTQHCFLSVCPPSVLSICLSIHLPTQHFCLSVHLSVHPPTHLSIYLSSIRPSIYPSVPSSISSYCAKEDSGRFRLFPGQLCSVCQVFWKKKQDVLSSHSLHHIS